MFIFTDIAFKRHIWRRCSNTFIINKPESRRRIRQRRLGSSTTSNNICVQRGVVTDVPSANKTHTSGVIIASCLLRIASWDCNRSKSGGRTIGVFIPICLLRTASRNCNRSTSGGRHYSPNNGNIVGSSFVKASITLAKDSRTLLVRVFLQRRRSVVAHS